MKYFNGRRVLVLMLLFSSAHVNAEFRPMYFREMDGETQHLYYANCVEGKNPVCSLKVMSVSTDKSPRACFVTYQSLFINEPASSPQKDTFSVSVGSGACGYTNTYVISTQSLVQTKTSPPTVPENLKPHCQTFAPKIYRADVFVGDKFGFMNVPTGSCKEIHVMLE